MGKSIEITRLDHSASANCGSWRAGREDGDVVRRLLGVALVLEG